MAGMARGGESTIAGDRDACADLILRHARPVPRYTSYPTAPHFEPRVGYLAYVTWLAGLPRGARLSLYLHIPFCDRLCWYCGCSTKAVRRYEPVAEYLRALTGEIENVGAILAARGHRVTHVHLGGGSPDILQPIDIARLSGALRGRFELEPGAEVAVEIDPRNLDDERAEAFARAGVTRVSLGVQDFDPIVQKAIGREQSFEVTRAAVEAFRRRGVRSINIDLIYGLPHQTEASVARTIAQVLTLAPDRIAAFGYAHLPARMKHQRLIDEEALPDAMDRFAQSERLARLLEEAGYLRVGLDHYARAGDALAGGGVRRNFQGYTTDDADALLGFGASAIGRLPDGYVQNAVAAGDYQRRIATDGLATARGLKLDADDRLRGFAIERIMCDLELSLAELEHRFGGVSRALKDEVRALVEGDRDGLVEATRDGFRVTERGRPFVRSICARFDAYLGRGTARHSSGV